MSFINIATDKHCLINNTLKTITADPHRLSLLEIHNKQLPSSIPNFDTLEGFSTEGNDDYSTFKKLQRQLEYVAFRHVGTQVANSSRYIHLQEEYIKDEQRSLKRELVRAQEEIKRIQSVPLVIGQFMEAIDQK